jgi:hypothetical protein
VKYVAGNEHDVRPDLNDPVDCAAECGGNVGLTLIDAGRGHPLKLAEAEVQVGEVYESHAKDVVSVGACGKRRRNRTRPIAGPVCASAG